MTLKQLSDRIDLGTCLNGRFQVTIRYRGGEYRCKSNNTLAYEAVRSWSAVYSWSRDTAPGWYYTPKQAYQALWDECKRANKL